MNENAMYFINIDNDYSKPSAKNFKELIKTANINNDKNLFMLNNEVNFIKSVNNINKNMAKRFNQTSVKDIVNAKNIIINETV
jgi:ribosomal protein L4